MALFHSIQKAGGQWASSCSSSRTLFSSRPCPGQHMQKDHNRRWVHRESHLRRRGPGHWAGFSRTLRSFSFRARLPRQLTWDAFQRSHSTPSLRGLLRGPPGHLSVVMQLPQRHQRLLPSPQSSLRCFCFLCISRESCSGTRHTQTALSVALSGRPHSHHPWRIQAHLR